MENYELPKLEAHGQGYKDMSPAVDEFERLVLSEQLTHEDNPVMNMCINNSQILTDASATSPMRKIIKVNNSSRIDCAVAALMAVRPDDQVVDVVFIGAF